MVVMVVVVEGESQQGKQRSGETTQLPPAAFPGVCVVSVVEGVGGGVMAVERLCGGVSGPSATHASSAAKLSVSREGSL